MDGNGRWARRRGKERVFGHHQGVKAVRKIIEAAAETGIEYLTLYAFSTENWNRPNDEVSALMDLMVSTLSNETAHLLKNDIRLLVIGDSERFSPELRKNLNDAICATAGCTRLNLIIALSYSSRWELVNACRKIAVAVKEGRVDIDSIDEAFCLF